MKPKKLVIKLTKHRFLYCDKSSAVTPKYFSFIQTPIMGESILEAKLVVPVKNAKTVPSILAGVILAKSARVGRVLIACAMTPKMVSVNTMKAISLMPNY